MKDKSWPCTIITQLSLCMLAYIALNIGQPQNLTQLQNGPNDMFFISVVGGFRPLEEHTLLLQQMVKAKKTYKARFVIEFSEHGVSDLLLQNATMFPELQNMPWYHAGALGGQRKTYFLKKINTPYGQTIDIIALDTVMLQDQSSALANDQIAWLVRSLNESKSDWKIVVGFHRLISSDNNTQNTKTTPFESLHDILLQYEADVYMSMKSSGGNIQGSATTGPYLTAINQNLISKEQMIDGFFLHRVSSFEMVSSVVKLTGEVERRLSFQRKGRAAM